jgi:hypothetical protein
MDISVSTEMKCPVKQLTNCNKPHGNTYRINGFELMNLLQQKQKEGHLFPLFQGGINSVYNFERKKLRPSPA